MSALLTLANAGWRNKRTIEVANPVAAWEVSRVSTASMHLPARVAHGLGFSEFKGLWARLDCEQMGIWGGIVRRNPSEIDDGTMEISCDSFHRLLKGVRTARTFRQSAAPAGALWLQAIAESATDRRIWIDTYQADEDGPMLEMEWHGDDLYDVSDYLASNSDHEWDVVLNDDWSISAEFRREIGADKRGTVLLADGWNAVSGIVSPSIDNLENDILAVNDDHRWEDAESIVAIDPDSIDEPWGRQQATRRYAPASGIETLYIRAKQDLDRLSQPAIPATVLVPLRDPNVERISHGDTVNYWSARQNAAFDFRVLARSYDRADGRAKYAGECVAA